MSDIPVFFILEWYGAYLFWPNWTYYRTDEGGIDYRIMDIPMGSTMIPVVPEFIWPDTGTDRVNSLWFYGAMLNPAMSEILGSYAAVNWGYGP